VNRRDAIISLVALGAGDWSVLAFGQQDRKIWRIGMLLPTLPDTFGSRIEAFRLGLRELGYIEGKNIVLEIRWAEGKYERLPELASELVGLKVDVLVTSATLAADVARRTTRTIPIVMASIADPVGAGLVESLARPGGNMTGLTLMSPELAGKRMQLVRELLPKATRVGVISSPSTTETTRQQFIEEYRRAGEQIGVQILVQRPKVADELPELFANLRRNHADALMVQIGPFTGINMEKIIVLAASQRLPVIYDNERFVTAGGFISYGIDLDDVYRRTATYVDKILKGARPGDLPIEQPTKIELVINLKTARGLGITIPKEVLFRADRVIE
jgi:putative ABC transport system substrate-binding protein